VGCDSRKVFIKDQVNLMFYGTNNVSTRTLLKLMAGLLFALSGVGAASAANTGIAPQLVPYEMQAVAGNNQLSYSMEIPGYGGDGLSGTAATLSAPGVLTVDAAGNVYFADPGNALIREVNAQTGVINTVAGQQPSACSGTVCSHVNSGCADGVAAAGNPIGTGLHGIAVDAYGNLYFSESITNTISVVYRGGTRVANFIKLEDPAGVALSNGVQAGFIYHIAGTVNLSNCAGTASAQATSTKAAVPAGDGNLAFNSGATFSTVGPLSLDSAGNLYIGDAGINTVIRVINTQAQAQTFFGVSVQPGYIQSIVNCGSLTQICPTIATPETLANTGVGGPAAGGVFNTLANGEGAYMSTDGYGNIYELNYKGANPEIAMAVAYAGGAPLANLINNANAGASSSIAGTAGLKAVAGDFYYILQSITLRPSSVTNDPVGNVYYEDNHYGQIYRIDVNAQPYASYFLEVSYLDSSGLTSDSNRTYAASNAVPGFCYPTGGQSTTNPTLTGYETFDQFGNGCPVIYAEGTGIPHSGTGYGTVLADGPGNLWIADQTNDQIRKVVLNNIFPVTPVGQQWNTSTFVGEQGLQIHFDGTNLPIQTTTSPSITTSAFAISPGIPDFTINPVEEQYTTATGGGLLVGPTSFTYTGAPTGTQLPVCTNVTGANDKSQDCVLNVIFSPTLPGLREGQLAVTTANGSTYTYGLVGIGSGPQLVIDGGSQAVVPTTGIANPGEIAVTQGGTMYIADPTNNRIVVQPVGGGTQTTIGTGLKSPLGVAVDASGNVYIADTGNNRIVEVAQATGAQTVIGNILVAGTPAYANYTFKSPQGIAVDTRGNVFVADTGNAAVVEIPSDPKLGGATPLLQYPGAPTFSNPVAIALDNQQNIYVADSGNIQVVKIPAGGGDLQTLPASGAPLPGFGSVLTAPSGVAVDAAGDVYVSDAGTNQVYELPSASGLTAITLPINFTGLNLTGTSPSVAAYSGGSLALDASGNLYVSDPGNSRVLFENRQNPTVNCGLVAQDQPAATCGGTPVNAGANTLTVTNIGNQPATIISPFATVTSGNSAFALTNNCPAGTYPSGGLLPGAYCTISPTFLPTSDGAQSESFTVNGTTQSVTLTGTGEQPLVKLVLSNTPTTGSGTAGTAITVTATLSQPNTPPGGTPSGTVAFSYTVDGGAAVVMTPMAMGAGGTSTASFTIPGTSVLQGRLYVVNATYQGDANDSPTIATPLSIYVPGVPVTATAAPITYTYGQAVPAIVGAVTGITDPSVTYKFVTAATASSPTGTYPINVLFSGGTYLNYGYGAYPPVYATGSTTTLATVTENPAALTVKANNATTQYGAGNLSFTSVITGLVNGDKLAESYSPAQSSILAVGTYPIIPTVLGKATGNYKVTVVNGTLTVTAAPTAITIVPTATQMLPANLAANPIIISVGTLVTAGKGTPTGTVTITDTFTPIIATAPGTGTALAPATIGPLALTGGLAKYTITSITPGTHVYSFAYSGDSNFQASTTLSTTSILVDNADFTVSLPTTPIIIAPGVIPGGNASVYGQAAATPETAVVSVVSILSYAGTIYLGCQPQNPSYVTCTVSPPVVTISASSTATAPTTSLMSVSTPATLPLGFFGTTSQLRKPVNTVLAFLPLGFLALFVRRSRRKLSNALWMLILIAMIGTGLNGCADTSVDYYTPVPSGPQTVTVYACTSQSACTSTPTSPITGTGTGVIRSFTVPINIE
jgi:sugar lactone lactonase YvrE